MSLRTHRLVGANATRARSHNRQILLQQLRNAGPLGRAEIARATGLSTQAVSNIIAQLLRDALLVEDGATPRNRGLPVMRYALNPSGGYALGIEIRPDALLGTLLDFLGRPLFSTRRPLPASCPDALRAPLATLKADVLSDTGIREDRLLGAGVVLPGPFGPTGIRGNPSELSGWEETNAREWLAAELDLPVQVEKDANAAAMVERTGTAAEGASTFAYLYFGAGIGLGLVEGGRLVTGAFGNAGEIGHIDVQVNGRTDRLETFVSRLSVQAHLADQKVTADTTEALDALYQDRHPAVLDWLAVASQALAQAVSTVENLFDPATTVMGGAMPASLLDALIEQTDLSERSVALRPDRGLPRLVRGTTGRMTATHGAATLILDEAFTPKIALAS